MFSDPIGFQLERGLRCAAVWLMAFISVAAAGVGLMMSGDQNDNQMLNNVAVQGCRYGLVPWEHVVADYLYGIHDPGNRLWGAIVWRQPWGNGEFPVEGAKNRKISRFPLDSAQ